MPTFPIPTSALYGTFTEGMPARAVIRTQMEVGRAKTRRRSSMGSRPLAASYAVTDAQLDSFKAWFAATIGMGAESFDWDDPRTGTARVVRFVDDGWSIAQIAPTHWRLDVRFEEWA